MIGLQAPSQIITTDETLIAVRVCVVYKDGKPQQKTADRVELIGNVQPLNGRELLLVPEGDRHKEQYWLWTTGDVRVNDRVMRCGVNFQVQTVQTWGSYSQALLMRDDVGPLATP